MKTHENSSMSNVSDLIERLVEMDHQAEDDARAVESHRVELGAARRTRLRLAAASTEVRVPLDVAVIPATALARQAGAGVHAWYLVCGERCLLSFVNLSTRDRVPTSARCARSGTTWRITEVDGTTADVSGVVSLPELREGARFFRFSSAPTSGDTLLVHMGGDSTSDVVDVLWTVPGAPASGAIAARGDLPLSDDELSAPSRDLRWRMNALVTAYQAAIRYRARVRQEAEEEARSGKIERVPGTITKPVHMAMLNLFERFRRLPPWARLTVNWYACELVRCFNPATFEGFGLLALAKQDEHAYPGFRDTLKARLAKPTGSRG